MRLFFLLAFFLIGVAIVQAQDPQTPYVRAVNSTNRIYEVTLKDGTKLMGWIIYQDDRISRIRTANQREVTVQVDQVQTTRQLDGITTVGVSLPNLFAHRLVFGPTAIPLLKSSWYFNQSLFLIYGRVLVQPIYLPLPVSDFSVGLTSRLSVGVGFLSVAPPAFYNLKTKLTVVQTEKLALPCKLISTAQLAQSELGDYRCWVPSEEIVLKRRLD